MRKHMLLAMVLAVLLFQTVEGSSQYQRWELSNDWYGYPVISMVNNRDIMCAITSDEYQFTPHYKIPVDTSGISASRPDRVRENAQAWFLGYEWTLNENLGDNVLSNIVSYKNNLYVSVIDEDNKSCIMEYDGHDWETMNQTEDWNVIDMVVCDNLLYVVRNGSNEIAIYNGISWRVPLWDVQNIVNLGVYEDDLIVSTVDELYILKYNNLTEFERPSSKVIPIPMTTYNGDLYASYRNQIYSYNGYNWSLIKVVEPLYFISSMYPINGKLYIGTQTNPYENETKIFIYDGEDFEETTVWGNIVYSFEIFNNQIYTGTNLGLYELHSYVVIDENRIKYTMASCLILGLVCIFYSLYSWDEGLEDCILMSMGLSFILVLALIYFIPSLYLTYVILIAFFSTLVAITVMLNYIYNVQWEFRHTYKDVRVVAVVLIILLIIEVITQVFSKSIGI